MMKLFIKCIGVVLVLVLGACVSVNFLPTDDAALYPPTSSVKVYWEEPDSTYIVIGLLSVASGDYGEEELFKRLKQKAMKVGAEAIVMKGTSQNSSVIGLPVSGGGTVMVPATTTKLEAKAIRFDAE